MTQAQLKSFQQKLASFEEVERILIQCNNGPLEYILVWWICEGKRYRLNYVFVLFNNTLLRRIEIDGYLSSYVLNALEKALKE